MGEERKYKKRHARRKEKLHGTCLDGRGSEGTMNNRVGLSELCDAARPGGVKLLAVLPYMSAGQDFSCQISPLIISKKRATRRRRPF